MYLEANQVPPHLRGSYSGQKFQAEIAASIIIPVDSGLWSGGSRDMYYAIRLADGRQISISGENRAPWDKSRQDWQLTIEPGIAVVRHSMVCGKDMGLTFFVNAADAAALLPAPSAELSPHEKIVLNATCSYKSSYGGRDRYQMARADVEYNAEKRAAFPSREQWETAKLALIDKGMLNKAGAVTVKGRNAESRD
jgi:hypothetical protein